MKPRDYFDGKTVAITGGSSGIGKALAAELLSYGAKVHLLARTRSVLEETQRELVARSPHGSIATDVLDVTDEAAAAAVLGAIANDGLDVLINSAGVTRPGRFLELPASEFRVQMDINYFGIVNACRAVLPRFVERRRGHVVNVGSLAGVIGIYGYSAYAATKFAVVGFSQALRAELWPFDVKVTLAHPADTRTPMLERETPERPEETTAIVGMAPPKEADVVARSILAGAANGDFEVWCDFTSRAMAFAQGVVPSVVRAVCDSAQRKARVTS